MKKLSIVATTSILAAIAMVGCGDDNDDNPGAPKGGTSSDAGESGGGTKNTGGTKATAGTGNTGNPEGGTDSVGGMDNMAGSGGSGETEPTCADVYADRPNGVKSIPVDAEGNITVDTLTSDTIWTLDGRYFVKEGETLTIEPCTLIEATPTPGAGSLFVTRGAKIHAVGTPKAPIVFTTTSHAFEAGAPWGGIVLLGKAPIAPDANATAERNFEGMPELETRARFGGTDAEDNSGEMAYVRIEFGGDIIVTGKEINGLSFGGVGSGTKIHHVMVKDQQDDCFEWFGGTVNADHLICQNSGDDMFDTDEGYRGKLQYLFGRNLTEGTSSDPRGFEWDGNKPKADAPEAKRSLPMGSNITLCGPNAAGTAVSFGAALRSNLVAGTTISNAIVTGWDFGVDTTFANGTADAPIVDWNNSLFFGQVSANAGNAAETDNDGGFDETAWLGLEAHENTVGGDAPAGFDCYAAVPTAPTTPVEGATPGEGFDEAGTFVGAFGAENWAEGSWVDWSFE
jgi:hypothetical protein